MVSFGAKLDPWQITVQVGTKTRVQAWHLDHTFFMYGHSKYVFHIYVVLTWLKCFGHNYIESHSFLN